MEIPNYLIPKWLESLMGNKISRLDRYSIARKTFPDNTILKLEKHNGEIGEYIVKDCRGYLDQDGDRRKYEFMINSIPRSALVQLINEIKEPLANGDRRAELETMPTARLLARAAAVGIPQTKIDSSEVSLKIVYNDRMELPIITNNNDYEGVEPYRIILDINPVQLHLSRLRLAFAMSLNKRLGRNSLLNDVPQDIITLIGENILEEYSKEIKELKEIDKIWAEIDSGEKKIREYSKDIRELEEIDKMLAEIDSGEKKGGGKKKKIKSKRKKKKTRKRKSKRKKYKTKRRKY